MVFATTTANGERESFDERTLSGSTWSASVVGEGWTIIIISILEEPVNEQGGQREEEQHTP